MSRDRDAEARLIDHLLSPRALRGLRYGLAAAGLATTLLSADAASADANWFGDGGIYLGYTWGRGGGFTWGLEGRVGADFRDEFACTNESSFGAAATARLDFVRLTRPGIAIGGQAGTTYGPTAAMGDLSLGYRWGENAGFRMPMGFDLQVWAASTFVRVDPALEAGIVGGGIRLPPPDRQFGCVVAGRALHDEEGLAELPPVRTIGPDEGRPGLGAELEETLVTEWGHRAQAEWASVPAFLQLAEQLDRAGAPRSLVDRALVAAEDELCHAVLTARMAVAYGGAPLGMGRVTPATRAPAEGREALRRLAVESWVDGCLGEGKAAAAAAREARSAELPELGEVQRTIAADEARHAELAWDVLEWTIRVGGDDVRDAVWATREAGPHEASGSTSDVDLSAFGLLPETTHLRVGDEVRETARTRLDGLLGRG